MFNIKQFNILLELHVNPNQSQRFYAEKIGISLGSYNEIRKELEIANLIADSKLTKAGIDALASYKVDNAIIMAAGMSTRMHPLSLEKPKGLMLVHGEVLIERLIKQLQEAGIKEIILVLGYMKEKFFYLKEKYGLEILINEDYYRYNNTSTLRIAEKYLKNSYICPSDTYFSENVFKEYEFYSFCSGIFFPSITSEHVIHFNKDNLIKEVNIGGENDWAMMGYTYLDKEFSSKYNLILKEEYKNPIVKTEYWEDVYRRYTDELKMYIKKMPNGIIYEFDSLDDLRKFDSNYLENTDFKVIKNISKALKCKQGAIVNIEPIKNAKRNLFSFEVECKKYFYEYPIYTSNQENYNESEALEFLSKENFAHSLIYVDREEGWKILKYNAHKNIVDSYDRETFIDCISCLKEVHSIKAKYTKKINLWAEIESRKNKLEEARRINFEEFTILYTEVKKIYKRINTEGNLVFSNGLAIIRNFYNFDKKIELAQWKNATMADPAFDMSSLLCFSNYSTQEIEEFFKIYYNKKEFNAKEIQHYKDYFILSSFYWYIVLLEEDSMQQYAGEELYNCYLNIRKYLQ